MSALLRTTGALLLAGGAVVAAAAYPAAWAADRALGTEGIVLTSLADEATVELQRATFDDAERDPAKRRALVAGIYGTALRLEPERVLLAAPEDLIRPPEAPELVLLRPRPGGWRQTGTLWFLAPRIAAGALLAALAGWFLRRRFSRS